MDPDIALASMASLRHGLLTRTDAVVAGLTPRQIERRVLTNRWRRVHRGVYAVAGSPRTVEQDLLAGCMATDGAASHRAGMTLWDVEPDVHRADISVCRTRAPYFEGIVLHRSGDLHPDHLTERRGVPVTNPLRTLADIGAVSPRWCVQRFLEQGLARRLFSGTSVVGVRWELSRQGRSGLGALEWAIDRAGLHLGVVESVLEAAFARLCITYDLPAPELQHEVVVGGRRRRIDAAWPGPMVAVEVDGFASRIDRGRFQDDRTRQNALVQAGWTVIRFTWDDVMRRPHHVATTILKVLGRETHRGGG